jgi:hypothetical protein
MHSLVSKIQRGSKTFRIFSENRDSCNLQEKGSNLRRTCIGVHDKW